jgi:hypothetical protein
LVSKHSATRRRRRRRGGWGETLPVWRLTGSV